MDHSFTVSGRVAVITGGASGIGAACAKRLEQAGATSVTWDIASKASIKCDVSDASSVDRAIAETCEQYGVPSILVASAGVGSSREIMHFAPDEWDRIFSVNVRGTMLTMQAVARGIRDSDELDGGSMVVVSSINSVVADRGVSAYGASKAAVNQLVRVAAREFGPKNIRVNAVAPGPTDTPMLASLLAHQNYRDEIVSRSALGRIGSAELSAEAAVGLMQMGWVTGQTLLADGGISLYSGRSDEW